jgi:hypothetical protein
MRCSERSANRSGKCRDAFCTSRTTRNRRPPRRYWDRTQARDSWWQPTTRPPRTCKIGGVGLVGCQSSLMGNYPCGRGGRRSVQKWSGQGQS